MPLARQDPHADSPLCPHPHRKSVLMQLQVAPTPCCNREKDTHVGGWEPETLCRVPEAETLGGHLLQGRRVSRGGGPPAEVHHPALQEAGVNFAVLPQLLQGPQVVPGQPMQALQLLPLRIRPLYLCDQSSASHQPAPEPPPCLPAVCNADYCSLSCRHSCCQRVHGLCCGCGCPGLLPGGLSQTALV